VVENVELTKKTIRAAVKAAGGNAAAAAEALGITRQALDARRAELGMQPDGAALRAALEKAGGKTAAAAVALGYSQRSVNRMIAEDAELLAWLEQAFPAASQSGPPKGRGGRPRRPEAAPAERPAEQPDDDLATRAAAAGVNYNTFKRRVRDWIAEGRTREEALAEAAKGPVRPRGYQKSTAAP
jgi:hypothetical protein